VYASDPNPFAMGCIDNTTTILCAPQRPSRLMRIGKEPIEAWLETSAAAGTGSNGSGGGNVESA